MRPSKCYRELQSELVTLIKADNASDKRHLRVQLEREFTERWGFGPDRLRLGSKLGDAIKMFETKRGDYVRGFDHCTYYTGENDQRIIVTQPYCCRAGDIKRDLTLNNGIRPEVIDASEWGFHYPGRAELFIVKFPFGFLKAMDNYKKMFRRAELEEALRYADEEAVCV